MRKLGGIAPEELSFIDPQDTDAPGIVQFATRRMEKAIISNCYEPCNYKSIILNYEHGTNFKAKLELKPNAKPFCQRAYKKIPIAKQEAVELAALVC
jgi:hypothetical protein